jgi:hypothetical protein
MAQDTSSEINSKLVESNFVKYDNMAQDTSSEINSKLVEYFIEMLFDENVTIDRIRSRKEEYTTFHVGIEGKIKKKLYVGLK